MYKRILSQDPLENEVNLEFKELDWIEWWNEPKIGTPLVADCSSFAST